jgi:integrase
MRRAGAPGTLHTLRHFWASVLISTGNDIAAVSKAIGHANVGVTSDVYGWLYEEGRKAMAAAGCDEHRAGSALGLKP